MAVKDKPSQIGSSTLQPWPVAHPTRACYRHSKSLNCSNLDPVRNNPVCQVEAEQSRSLRLTLQDQARSKRSRFITLFQAATKSWTNFPCASELP